MKKLVFGSYAHSHSKSEIASLHELHKKKFTIKLYPNLEPCAHFICLRQHNVSTSTDAHVVLFYESITLESTVKNNNS